MQTARDEANSTMNSLSPQSLNRVIQPKVNMVWQWLTDLVGWLMTPSEEQEIRAIMNRFLHQIWFILTIPPHVIDARLNTIQNAIQEGIEKNPNEPWEQLQNIRLDERHTNE